MITLPGSPALWAVRFANFDGNGFKHEGGFNMRSLLHKNGLIAVLVVAGFVFSLGMSQALAQKDTEAKKTVVKGADQMMAGKKLLMNALGKQKLDKDPKLANGIKMLNEGEKLTMTGKKMMKEKAEAGKIKGKEEMMSGTTKMMQGKDEIMNELKARGMMQEANLKAAEKDFKKGEDMMLDGKNMMMDGLKNFE
jgi:hypothetical protein